MDVTLDGQIRRRRLAAWPSDDWLSPLPFIPPYIQAFPAIALFSFLPPLPPSLDAIPLSMLCTVPAEGIRLRWSSVWRLPMLAFDGRCFYWGAPIDGGRRRARPPRWWIALKELQEQA